MPELPEVETVRRGLAPVLVGRLLVRVEQRRPDLRFPFPEDFAARLGGRRIEALGRRAKYLIADLDDGLALVMHLGMSGSFRTLALPVPPAPTAAAAGLAESGARPADATVPGLLYHPRAKLEAHDHVVFHLEDGATVVYNDPRRFGYMTLIARARLAEHPLFAGLGIEPLGNELSGDTLARAFAGRRAPLEAALLDQRLIAGLGNIYACEALWRARLSPRRPAGSLVRKDGRPGRRATLLADSIRAVLSEAVAAGGSSLRDYVRADGSLGYFQHAFAVYDREDAPCPRPSCHGAVARIVQSGRSTFHCPVCQR
jgi:formamidopyrimidine-DNA glycosylase